jgi:hypothetical protein
LNPVSVRIGIGKVLEKRCQAEEHGTGYEKMKKWLTGKSLQQRGSATARDRAPMNIWPSTRKSGGLNRKIELLSDGMHFTSSKLARLTLVGAVAACNIR